MQEAIIQLTATAAENGLGWEAARLNNRHLVPVTHCNKFHADDVTSAAVLLELGAEAIMRTRQQNIIDGAEFVFDVGRWYNPMENKFDHHQFMNGDPQNPRRDGRNLSSIGMIWGHYGGYFVMKYLEETQPLEVMTPQLVWKLWNHVDTTHIRWIDQNDTSEPLDRSDPAYEWNQQQYLSVGIGYARIINFLNLRKAPVNDRNYYFDAAVRFARHTLKNVIEEALQRHLAEQYILASLANSKKHKLQFVVFPDFCPGWIDAILADPDCDDIQFGIWPDEDEETNESYFMMQAVPPSAVNMKGQRCAFPLEWRGHVTSDTLQVASDVWTLDFVHSNGFLAKAGNLEDAVKAVRKAIWMKK